MLRQLACCVLCLWAAAARAELLPPGADGFELPIEVVLGKPMLAVQVNGQAGRMMLDTGTPEPVFFNRDALSLSPGQAVGQGRAASGQPVVVERVEAPVLRVLGRRVPLAAQAMTGNFQFVEAGFGADFLGFIGAPMLRQSAFLLDLQRRRLVLLRVDGAGRLQGGLPTGPVLEAEVHFSLPSGGLPTTVGVVGGVPMLLDFDTGDSGTLYLRPASLAALLAAGQVERVASGDGDGQGEGEALVLRSLRFGGGEFAGLRLQLVEAGGQQDFRANGQPDLLRLGADFLATRASLWNYPAHRLGLLRPDSGFPKLR